MPASQANVATEHASRYLQRLCKHWAHKFPVEFGGARPPDRRGAYPAAFAISSSASTVRQLRAVHGTFSVRGIKLAKTDLPIPSGAFR